MAAPIITPIPTPPIRSDAPADFAVKADNFAAALPQFVTETNGSASFVDQRAIDADASATAAANSANSASSASTKASQWADAAENVEVEPGKFSALHQAIKAAGSATTAQGYADNLATLDALWLGSAASDPATGKDGAALVAGNAYVNTVTGYLRAYNGTAWVQGVSEVAGVSSLNGQTGDLTGIATQAGVETLTNKTVVDPVVTLGGSQGVAGQVPISQGAGLPPVWGGLSSIAGLGFVRVFAASGTWTKPAGLKRVRVTVVGGGQSGNGGASSAQYRGGWAGGAAVKLIESVDLAGSVAITVGAGGVYSSGTAGSGGSSSFGSHCSATGGTSSAGGGSGGDINLAGGGNAGGGGGTSLFGGGGAATGGYGGNGLAPGAAGGGGYATGGGNGAAGIVIIEEYY